MPDYQHGGVDPHTLMPKTYSARVLRTIMAAASMIKGSKDYHLVPLKESRN